MAQILNWSFDSTDACNGTNLSSTTYYGSLPLTAGDVLYSNSGCSTPASTGRYIVLGGNVLYVNVGGVLSNYTC